MVVGRPECFRGMANQLGPAAVMTSHILGWGFTRKLQVISPHRFLDSRLRLARKLPPALVSEDMKGLAQPNRHIVG